MKNEIIIFENQNVKLEVNIKDDTVWLNLEQISNLFDRDKSVISRHIKNILKEEVISKDDPQKMRVDGVKQFISMF